jgi:hypothetical protein
MLVSRQCDADDGKHEAKLREEEQVIEAKIRKKERQEMLKMNQTFMQQMMLIMTMGQQQLQPNQIANITNSMTVPLP